MTLEEYWQIKEEISLEISKMTNKEVIDYFNDAGDWGLKQIERIREQNKKNYLN
jgi:hypothetical protein